MAQQEELHAVPGPAARLEVLLDISSALALARTPDEVAQAAASCMRRDAGGAGVVLYTLERPEGPLTALNVEDGIRLPPEFRQVPLQSPLPLARCVASRQPLFHAPKARLEVDGFTEGVLRSRGLSAFACLPLMAEDRLLGALSISYCTLPEFEAADAEFLVAVARHVAMALERAQAYRTQARAREWADFSAQVLPAIVASADPLQALRRAARAAVGQVADWVTLYLVQGGRAIYQFAAHRDPGQEALADEINRAFPPAEGRNGAMQVAADGQARLFSHVTAEDYRRAAASEAEAQARARVKVGSAILVPVRRGEQTLGVIAFARDAVGFYGPQDLEHAQDFASRAALALDSAVAHQARTNLLNLVAHEISNPLLALRMWVEMQAAALPGGEAALAPALRSINRIHRLMGDLRDAASVQGEGFEVHPTLLDLAGTVQSMVALQQGPCRAAALTLTAEVAGPLPVFADEQRLEQVMENLLGNARKFTAAGGSIAVRAERVGNEVLVRVCDTGLGLDRAQLGRLFQPFSRAHEGSGRPGLGLGLFVSRGIVERMGGRVWAESDGPGKGSRFCLALPLAT